MLEQIARFLELEWGIKHPAEFFFGIAVCTAIPFFLIVFISMMTYRPATSPSPDWKHAKLGVVGSFLGTLGYSMVGAFLPFFSPDRVPDLIIMSMLIGNVLGIFGLIVLLFSVLNDWRGFLAAGQQNWDIWRVVVWRLPLTVITIYFLCLGLAVILIAK